jgi:hypothetical protein
MGQLLEFFKTVDITSAVMIGILVLIAAVIGLLALLDRHKNRQLREAMEKGKTIVGWVVQAKEFDNADAPAQVLITFEELANDREVLERLASRLVSIVQNGGADEIEKKVAGLMTNLGHVPDLRVRLPVEFTGGPVVYSYRVRVQREHLPNGKLTDPFVECQAIPGDEGPVFMVPYSRTTNNNSKST